jgi:hypothetical protein
MLNLIRVALVSVALACVGLPAEQSVQNPAPVAALENENVRVLVDPPAHAKSINLCFNIDEFPFVRLFLPTPTSENLDRTDGQGRFTGYFDVKEPYGCTPQDSGTTVYLYLKSAPAAAEFKDDAARSDETHNEVLFENSRVRVVRVHFRPGESGPMVDKRPRLIAAVSDSHATVTFPDGHCEAREMKAGAVSFGNAGRQATKNTGTTPLENIVVELKSKDAEKK